MRYNLPGFGLMTIKIFVNMKVGNVAKTLYRNVHNWKEQKRKWGYPENFIYIIKQNTCFFLYKFYAFTEQKYLKLMNTDYERRTYTWSTK